VLKKEGGSDGLRNEDIGYIYIYIHTHTSTHTIRPILKTHKQFGRQLFKKPKWDGDNLNIDFLKRRVTITARRTDQDHFHR
jgi:hypothetical protein